MLEDNVTKKMLRSKFQPVEASRFASPLLVVGDVGSLRLIACQDDDEDVSDDDEEAMNHEPTQEEIEAALKYKMTKQAEAEKIKSYNERV